MNEKASSTEIGDLCREAIMAQYPEQANYWLNTGRGRHTEITLAVTCPRCNCEKTVTLKSKGELNRLMKEECSGCVAQRAAENRHLEIPMPFGKFRGKTINFVMEEQPNYLAWFVDQIKGQDKLVEQIKTHTQFPQTWVKYKEKQACTVPKELREAREWREGKFSQQTIDEVCNRFFGGD
jgi:uncharacterized protein (DUF3820 family)